MSREHQSRRIGVAALDERDEIIHGGLIRHEIILADVCCGSLQANTLEPRN